MTITWAVPLEEVLALPFASSDPDDLARARVDRSGVTGHVNPLAVARPRSIAQVQEVMSIAHRTGLSVIPRGAGTGLAGGAAVTSPAIVLDLTAMNRILAIDVANQTATVEPGVITAVLDAAARKHGLRYAPDPASASISTIGGNIATNAGGLQCVKYGVTRDAVRSLEVVLADGRLISTGSATIKSVAGYDLTSLFVGSEGTLGIIVGATLSLTATPVRTGTLSATFRSPQEAAAAVTGILTAGVRPSVVELLDAPTLVAIDNYLGTELSAHGGALLIIQTDGFGAEAELAAALGIVEKLATRVEFAADAEHGARLLEARRQALPAIEALGRVLIEDISVPLSHLPQVIAQINRISQRTGVQVFVFAHAGDGNVHPIILIPDGEADPELLTRVEITADAIFGLALEVGGSVSGEHGIGLLKREWLKREISPETLQLQREIRTVFDPTGILNPGKAL